MSQFEVHIHTREEVEDFIAAETRSAVPSSVGSLINNLTELLPGYTITTFHDRRDGLMFQASKLTRRGSTLSCLKEGE